MKYRKTHSSFEINIEPVWNVHCLASPFELLVQINGPQVADFDCFQHVVYGNVVFRVFSQNRPLVIQNSEMADGGPTSDDQICRRSIVIPTRIIGRYEQVPIIQWL